MMRNKKGDSRMALVIGSDYIVGEILVGKEKLIAVTSSHTGALLEPERLLKLREDIDRLLELVSVEEIAEYNAMKVKETYDEWVAMNQGYNEPKERTRKKKTGYVYVIKEHFSDTHKIGMTVNIRNRQSTFGLTLPFEWNFVKIYKSNHYVLLEELLHKKFDKQRGKGEWFNLSDEELTYINEGILEDGEISPLILEVVPCPA